MKIHEQGFACIESENEQREEPQSLREDREPNKQKNNLSLNLSLTRPHQINLANPNREVT